jgi:hypothetical protein
VPTAIKAFGACRYGGRMTDLVRRRLVREEIGLLWTIDRRELVERVYDLHHGALTLRPGFFDIPGWQTGEAEKAMPLLEG